jgi:hypothetical protein
MHLPVDLQNFANQLSFELEVQIHLYKDLRKIFYLYPNLFRDILFSTLILPLMTGNVPH